ncbi:A/G-specific adenine glycosylase [Alterisphingorhabdus coralli]|uniref:Adenine DNA glycosylase n=1 Tax=Alterisphingorhabdus coralli TaxID=3071408 RepID=A0AA97F900_9SPHN|nr:A/G-specific adenine glycosylase [Parasphingorhabdus sp. SCSIO 66989]WOE76679.1 A/G-specific adenine glycosylase [Parasphingorhabdus sp. SCSIO 66989]
MPVEPDFPDTDKIPRALLAWYESHARDLPWRKLPNALKSEGAPDPYHVWLSEIMLQQTTVAAVKPYFAEFTRRWPDVQALAAADEADVLAAWAGLGYYARARNLIACAKVVMSEHDGRFPDNETELLKLPGIGAYTAAAIAAIGFDQHAVVVDANVERVVARLFGIDAPLPGSRSTIREYAEQITPHFRAGDFAQAMMDLGATLCRARDAKCLLCPLSDHCAARNLADPTRIPVKAPKKAKPQRIGHAYWLEAQGHVALVERPAKGMLGGMRALPDDGWRAGADGDGIAPAEAEWENRGEPVAHVFTHFSLQLQLMVATPGSFDPDALPDVQWWPVDNLDNAGLPTLFAKVARRKMG